MNTPILTIDWKAQLIKALRTLAFTLIYTTVAAILAFITNTVPGLLQNVIQNPYVLTVSLAAVKIIGDTIAHWLSDEQGKLGGKL